MTAATLMSGPSPETGYAAFLAAAVAVAGIATVGVTHLKEKDFQTNSRSFFHGSKKKKLGKAQHFIEQEWSKLSDSESDSSSGEPSGNEEPCLGRVDKQV